MSVTNSGPFLDYPYLEDHTRWKTEYVNYVILKYSYELGKNKNFDQFKWEMVFT